MATYMRILEHIVGLIVTVLPVNLGQNSRVRGNLMKPVIALLIPLILKSILTKSIKIGADVLVTPVVSFCWSSLFISYF